MAPRCEDYDQEQAQPRRPVTILDVAIARGAQEHEGCISGGEFARVGLAILGGCAGCGATLGAFNAYPSDCGFWRCADCIGDTGFDSVEEFEGFITHGDEMYYERVCRICGGPRSPRLGGCTNGLCADCHRTRCTPGGNDSPGHDIKPATIRGTSDGLE